MYFTVCMYLSHIHTRAHAHTHARAYVLRNKDTIRRVWVLRVCVPRVVLYIMRNNIIIAHLARLYKYILFLYLKLRLNDWSDSYPGKLSLVSIPPNETGFPDKGRRWDIKGKRFNLPYNISISHVTMCVYIPDRTSRRSERLEYITDFIGISMRTRACAIVI